MATLYKPVLIESAEQAEALPVGTVAHRAVIGGPARYAATRTPSNDWYIGGREFQDHDFMIGWTALVPIEAEEEFGAEMKWEPRATNDTHVSVGLNLDNARWQAENNPDHATGRIMRHYRTPWEEA